MRALEQAAARPRLVLAPSNRHAASPCCSPRRVNFCPQCGSRAASGYRFCPACGTALDGCRAEPRPGSIGRCHSPLIEARGLSKSFGPAPILRGVNLQIDAGAAAMIIGRNGAGKSTLVAHSRRLVGTDHRRSAAVRSSERTLSKPPMRARTSLVTHQSFLYPEPDGARESRSSMPTSMAAVAMPLKSAAGSNGSVSRMPPTIVSAPSRAGWNSG